MKRFTPLSLALKSLALQRVLTLALVLGVAVATAVITGALVVGDSVRGSLRDLALARLGPVTHALVAVQPFDESLAGRIREAPALKGQAGFDVAPMLRTRGRAAGLNENVPGVDILAVGGNLDPTRSVTPARGDGPAPGVINSEIASHMSLAPTHVAFLVTLSVPSLADASAARESVLANRSRSAVLGSDLKVRVEHVASDAGFASLFSLAPSQRPPRIAWVPLRDLQTATGIEGKVNTLLFVHKGETGQLAEAVRRTMTLADYGLSMVKSTDGGHTQLMANSVYLPAPVAAAAGRAAAKVSAPTQAVTVNLANTLTASHSGKKTWYTTAAGVSALDDGTPLASGQVALNTWAARQLDAKVGDPVVIALYRRDRNGNIVETTSEALGVTLTVSHILPMTGIAIDRALTPTFKGMTDVEKVSDWKPPAGLKIDQKLADEPYWDEHRAAPKILLNFDTAQRLWSDSVSGGPGGGGQTGVRVPADKADAFAAALLAELKPDDVGMSLVPLREVHLAAAGGSTDFSGLFIGFSMFLVASALIIVAALFRLMIEQRARQLGVLTAVGFPPRRLGGILLREALIIATTGGLLGVGLAVGYAALMMHGLRTWWVGATGTVHLVTHLQPLTLAVGLVATLALVTLTVAFSIRRTLKTPPARLVAGQLGPDRFRLRSRRRFVYMGLTLALTAAAATLIFLALRDVLPDQVGYLSAGGLLLVAGLLGLRAALEPGKVSLPLRSITTYAVRSAGYRPARAVLTASLIALATFTLVTVASMRQRPPEDPRLRPSGTGGFPLILSADIPLPADLSTPLGRRILGIEDDENPLFQRARFTNLRSWQGQDASCLNMTKPTQPTILEFPPTLAQRFTLAAQKHPPRFLAENADGAATHPAPSQPARPSTDQPVPVLVDSETAQYILHVKIGDTLPITDQSGAARNLLIAAALKGSIFQSELLLPTDDFRRLFPHQTAFSTVLIECPPEDEAALTKLLQKELADFSVSIETSAARLARYQSVANTYLATFRALGSFGLLLGTLGVGVVLLRSVFERRAEIVGSSRVDLQACKLEYSIVSPK